MNCNITVTCYNAKVHQIPSLDSPDWVTKNKTKLTLKWKKGKFLLFNLIILKIRNN